MKDIHGVPYGERKFPDDPANMMHRGIPLEELFSGLRSKIVATESAQSDLVWYGS